MTSTAGEFGFADARMPLRAVLFDLDGTLIDSTEAIVESFFHTFDHFGHPRPDRGRIVDTISLVLEHQFAELCPLDAEECARVFRDHYAIVGTQKTVLHSGAAEILEWCTDRKLGIGFVTSKRRAAAEVILRHLGLLDHFDARVGPEDVSNPKPHPEPIITGLRQLDVGPEDAVYVGDTQIDIRAARSAGVMQTAVTTGYAPAKVLHAEKPHFVGNSLDDIQTWLAAQV